MIQKLKSIKLNRNLVQDLSKVAELLFPLETEAIISGTLSRGIFKAKEIILSPDISFSNAVKDIRFYREAELFEDLKLIVKRKLNNDICELRLSLLSEKKYENERLFKKYKECQRRRSVGECFLQTIELESCSKCDTFALLTHPGFDWVIENQPFLCWHTHPSSSFGNSALVSVPSFMDTLTILKLMEREPNVVGEIITVVFESGEVLNKSFLAPEAIHWGVAVLNQEKYRKRLVRFETPMEIL